MRQDQRIAVTGSKQLAPEAIAECRRTAWVSPGPIRAKSSRAVSSHACWVLNPEAAEIWVTAGPLACVGTTWLQPARP